MTDEQINERIAEACGWTDFIIHPEFGLMGTPQNSHGLRTAVNWYTVDLNAMHEAENALDESLRNQYIDWLGTIHTDSWEFATATARQRAEAFLRVLGKWEESE
jgi:hypothetical protein